MAKIQAFLRYTDRKPEETIGILLPENRAATVWATAVNGVMAGCRPEYMPILLALVEAMVDPIYGVEHSGNTPGAETLIVLNGPIIKDLNRSEEHTSELQSLMRISYAVFCLKKKKRTIQNQANRSQNVT